MAPEFMQALAGTRILDFSLLLPGPYATSILASFGAEVIKVEPPAGDPLRRMNRTVFDLLNRGKRSLCVDLRDTQARAAVQALAADCDAVIEGFRPRTLQRLGLGPQTLRQRKPRLVYTSISGFGWSGPLQDQAAHDLNFLALSGYFAVPAQLQHQPMRPQVRLADLVAGQYAAMATVMALMQAQRSFQGCHIDSSIYDAMTAWTAPTLLATPSDSRPQDMPHIMADSALYATADGQWLSLGTLEDKFWQAFVNAVKDVAPALDAHAYAHRSGRDRNKLALAQDLSQAIASQTLDFWQQRLAGVDTAVCAVLDAQAALAHPQLRARGFVHGPTHARVRFPALFDGHTLPDLGPAPTLGQDNHLLGEYA